MLRDVLSAMHRHHPSTGSAAEALRRAVAEGARTTQDRSARDHERRLRILERSRALIGLMNPADELLTADLDEMPLVFTRPPLPSRSPPPVPNAADLSTATAAAANAGATEGVRGGDSADVPAPGDRLSERLRAHLRRSRPSDPSFTDERRRALAVMRRVIAMHPERPPPPPTSQEVTSGRSQTAPDAGAMPPVRPTVDALDQRNRHSEFVRHLTAQMSGRPRMPSGNQRAAIRASLQGVGPAAGGGGSLEPPRGAASTSWAADPFDLMGDTGPGFFDETLNDMMLREDAEEDVPPSSLRMSARVQQRSAAGLGSTAAVLIGRPASPTRTIRPSWARDSGLESADPFSFLSDFDDAMGRADEAVARLRASTMELQAQSEVVLGGRAAPVAVTDVDAVAGGTFLPSLTDLPGIAEP